MIQNEDILCISSIDWDFIWQGHQEIMLRLARAGNRVLFIENTGARAPRLRDLPRLRQRWRNWRRGVQGIRRIEPGLYVYAPLVWPFPYALLARLANRWLIGLTLRPWMQAVGFKRPLAWVFLPTPLTLDLLRAVDPTLTIYYCIDSFAASSSAAHKVARTERRLIEQADLVFVTSKALHEYCAQWNPRVHDFPFGVSLEVFDAVAQSRQPVPEDLAALPSPRIGYVGGVHQWVDQALVRALAQRHPGWSFVLIGPIQTDVSELSGIANVHLLGPRPHQELPRYIQAFAVCMIPYHLTEYTRHVYPTKLNEYFALGKPVLSTALPEVLAVAERAQGSVLIGREPEEFARHLERLLKDGHADGAAQRQRRALAEENSWSAKLAGMSGLIEEELVRRRMEQELHWTERFLAFGRRHLRRLAKAVAAAGLAYGLVFHTPLLWWTAGPLKLEHAPAPADAIVVFAAGMGESGKAGEGHEERVQRAVGLYQEGLAPRLVFVSGYVRTFHETSVMRAIAIELGVPPQAIHLESRAANTYEGVVSSAEYLRQAGARRILFVSSPYHMRRAWLVWRHYAPEFEVRCVPVTSSRFYGDGSRVLPKHLYAVLHEYLGLGFYRWKGYWR
ncbi:MAG: YdcF family protein [Candidatus Omnitrophica bacterium]|nr:YdcF family protein [Candidatus Omnitrophota bacterium]